ncbi:MAG: DUF6159 family protein [Anaerolineae bacterium]
MFRNLNRRMQNGAELSRQSWRALRENPHLLVFPLVSLIGSLLVSIVMFVPIAGSALFTTSTNRNGDPQVSILTVVLLFIYYVLNYTVIIFSNTALIGAAAKIIRGEPATVRDGFDIAMSRIGKIIPYALLSATVGMVARAITQSGRDKGLVGAILAAIIGSIIQGAWNIIVFFAIPVLVYENVGLIDSLKRSFELFKQTWGESFTGNTVINAVGCLATLAIFVVFGGLIMLAIASGSTAFIVLSIALFIVAMIGLGLLSGAVNGVFQASMYQFAMTGDAGRYIDTNLAREAFTGGSR